MDASLSPSPDKSASGKCQTSDTTTATSASQPSTWTTMSELSLRDKVPVDPDSPQPGANQDAIPESAYTPSDYEKWAYYCGVAGLMNDDECPVLVYRSTYNTVAFERPVGRWAEGTLKSVCGVFGTPLNAVWDSVGLMVVQLLKQHQIAWTSVDPVRFYTRQATDYTEQRERTLGPVVIWIGVRSGSTKATLAHSVSLLILSLLRDNGVQDVVVEWREAERVSLAGPPLLAQADHSDPTRDVRKFLTPIVGLPLCCGELSKEDAQGTLTLWFHEAENENNDSEQKSGNVVLGLSNCHVLSAHPESLYEYNEYASRDKKRIYACGDRRFKQGLAAIQEALEEEEYWLEHYNAEVTRLSEGKIVHGDAESPSLVAEVESLHKKILYYTNRTNTLWTFLSNVTSQRSKIADRDLGYLHYAPPITVDEHKTSFTADWATFVASEEIVRPNFEGNIVYLDTKRSPLQWTKLFYPNPGGRTAFTYPHPDGKLRISDHLLEGELDMAAHYQEDGDSYFLVGKNGNTTGLTVGRCGGLASFLDNHAGVVSKELAVYNCPITKVAFADKGDSGSMVWTCWKGKTLMVGQLHSISCKEGTKNTPHISYCTPGWFLLEQIKKKYPNAVFWRPNW